MQAKVENQGAQPHNLLTPKIAPSVPGNMRAEAGHEVVMDRSMKDLNTKKLTPHKFIKVLQYSTVDWDKDKSDPYS